MKIEVDLINDKVRCIKHLKSLIEYLEKNMVEEKEDEFLGLPLYKLKIPKLGRKNFGYNIGTQDEKIFCISHTTKGGVYKFKLWGE